MRLYFLENCPECCVVKTALLDILGGNPLPIKRLCMNEIPGIETVYFLNSDDARDRLDIDGFEDDYTPLLVDGDMVYSEPEEIVKVLMPYLLADK